MAKGIVVVLAGLAILILVPIVVLLKAKPPLVPAPAAFDRYTAADKSFVCLAPAGWERTGGSSHGVVGGALFKKGLARIEISSDVTGSIMGDIAAASNRMASGMGPGAPAPEPPVEKLHKGEREGFAARFKECKEGAMKPFQSPIGEARYSEYTADGGFRVGKVHGYRVTILGPERRVQVFCQCPEANWETLKPAFNRVVGSLAAGSG